MEMNAYRRRQNGAAAAAMLAEALRALPVASALTILIDHLMKEAAGGQLDADDAASIEDAGNVLGRIAHSLQRDARRL